MKQVIFIIFLLPEGIQSSIISHVILDILRIIDQENYDKLMVLLASSK